MVLQRFAPVLSPAKGSSPTFKKGGDDCQQENDQQTKKRRFGGIPNLKERGRVIVRAKKRDEKGKRETLPEPKEQSQCPHQGGWRPFPKKKGGNSKQEKEKNLRALHHMFSQKKKDPRARQKNTPSVRKGVLRNTQFYKAPKKKVKKKAPGGVHGAIGSVECHAAPFKWLFQ